jgi:hypothetical protein
MEIRSLDMLLTGLYVWGVTAQCHQNLSQARANFHPGRKDIAMDDRHLTIAGLLADPMTLALMAADNVDPVELRAEWTALARKLALAGTTERRPERSK